MQIVDKELFLTNIIQSSPLGMHFYKLEPDNRLVFTGCNPAADKILKTDNKTFIGKTIEEAFPPLAYTEVPDRYRQAAKDGKSWQTDFIEYKDEKIKGFYKVYAFQTMPMHMVASFFDVTDYKKTEEALLENEKKLKQQNEEYYAINEELYETNRRIQQLNQELEIAKLKAIESDQLKSLFLANMSHEIRTPMNGIVCFANLLLNENLSYEKRKTYVDIINKSSEQLLSLISDIIDISKIEAGLLEIIPGECNINNLIRELFIHFDQIIKSKNKNRVKLISHVELADEISNFILDEVRLRQVLSNLIGNAVKFTSEGVIVFGYHFLTDGGLKFFVSDTGVGISKENIEKIFERFRQGDQNKENLSEGTGLGLSISRGLVKKMGGDIQCESELGHGATFSFILYPERISFFKVEKESTIKTDILSPDFQNKKILLVDDDELVHKYISELLVHNHVIILHAYSGTEAVEICNKHSDISLVLMDIRLPDKSGYHVTQNLKKQCPHIKIVAQTAYALTADKEKAIKAGCDDYISKPYQNKALIDIISKHLSQD